MRAPAVRAALRTLADHLGAAPHAAPVRGARRKLNPEGGGRAAVVDEWGGRAAPRHLRTWRLGD